VEHYLQSEECRKSRHESQLKDIRDRIRRLAGVVEPLFDLSDFGGIGCHVGREWRCVKCGAEFEDHLYSANVPRCPKCFPRLGCGKRSDAENDLFGFVKSIAADAVQGRRFGDRYELDVYVPSARLGIEFNGLYWHSEIFKGPRYHADKSEWFARERETFVVHVSEDEWAGKRRIVESVIRNRLGLSVRRVYARKCRFDSISSADYRRFLDENHVQGAVTSSNRFGLSHRGELVAVIGFGKSRFKPGETELHRYCVRAGHSVVGGFGKLLKRSGFRGVTYCDLRYFDGSGYRAVGFREVSRTEPGYRYWKRGSLETHSRFKFQKHRLADLVDFYDPNLSGPDIMNANGYYRVWDCGNVKMTYEGNL
jgi:DNA-directed RNA polymerase subunit RPC12/RpoP